jgi:hypothetical protein
MHDNCTQIATTIHDLWGHEHSDDLFEFMRVKVAMTFPEEIQHIDRAIVVQGFRAADDNDGDGNIIVNVDWSWREA